MPPHHAHRASSAAAVDRTPARPAHARSRLAALPVSVVAALVALQLGACVELEPVELRVSWLLADGRGCTEAGVAIVEVDVEASQTSSATFSCADGFFPAGVALGAFEPGLVKLEVRALSADGAVLYSSDARVELVEEPVAAQMQLAP